jgi:hypothetical protein
VYYRGDQLPTVGSLTPAQLRENSCDGPLVAPLAAAGDSLDAGAKSATPGTSAETSGLADFAPDPAGGMDVSVAPSANLFVVVLREVESGDSGANANDILACGAPLSGRNQYFDLYPPETGNAGIGLGTALMSPVVATRLDFTMTGDRLQPQAWAVHTGSCSGVVLASGSIKSNTSRPSGVIYQTLGTHPWWMTLSMPGGQTLCGEVTN